MRIDLHTHSDRSDGTVSPAELVRRAARTGLDVVALTDHDTADGWDEAALVAQGCGIGFVPGIEISCQHAGAAVHLLAYSPDPASEPLDAELHKVLAGRIARLPAILDRLRAAGIDITIEDVRQQAVSAVALGRPHVADALAALGVVSDRDEAFDRFLAPGRPGYAHRYAADLTETIHLVTAAGGVSVLAHPWARQSRSVLSAAVLTELQAHGLVGIEVDHQDHDTPTRAELRQLASRLGLVATGSSDYHGTGKVDHELGCNVTEPAELMALLAAARTAADAVGRSALQLAQP